MTKLLSYYTTARQAGSRSDNPRAAYIYLSQVGDALKTLVVTKGNLIEIPRWLLTDSLTIQQVLAPHRYVKRRGKDRLTISDTLTAMLQGCGWQYRAGGRTHLPKPEYEPAAVLDVVTFRDRVIRAAEVEGWDVTDIFKVIIRSAYTTVEGVGGWKQLPGNWEAVIAACRRQYGWTRLEIWASFSWYGGCEEAEWTAPEDLCEYQKKTDQK